jgi:hypothetical protein
MPLPSIPVYDKAADDSFPQVVRDAMDVEVLSLLKFYRLIS